MPDIEAKAIPVEPVEPQPTEPPDVWAVVHWMTYHSNSSLKGFWAVTHCGTSRDDARALAAVKSHGQVVHIVGDTI